jgi:hypothetical protein
VRVRAKVAFKAADGTPVSQGLTIFLKLAGSELRPK